MINTHCQNFSLFLKDGIEMNVYKPQVKDVSLFREIAKNIINPLEILREAISNSHDAEAKIISIIIYRNTNGNFVIEVQDDGRGMNLDDIHRFFNLGDSDKSSIGIGEKGLGTKTFFKSKKIILSTQTKNNEAFEIVMDNPWSYLCNGIIPEYTVEKKETEIGNTGTSVIIEDYIMDNPEKYFNFETIKDYVLWFTAAGSFKNYFGNCTELHKFIKNLHIAPRIFIEDKVLNIKEEIAGVHQFFPPQENPKEDLNEKIYKKSVNYCRHFGPYHKATNIDGDYVSFEVYGTISGVNCRRKIINLKQGETIKSRFGVYLAKDFIPFTKKTNLMTDPNYHHYHLLINSQAFELTADRNNLSNANDPKVKWVFNEVKKIIDNDINPLSSEGYFKLRKNEEQNYFLSEKQIRITNRLENFSKIDDLCIDELPIVKLPDNESQVIILFTSIVSNKDFKHLIKYIDKIGHYCQHSTTDLICIDFNNNKVLVEVEHKLSNLFKHEHPYETFDYVVCWSVDLEINEKKKLSDGNVLCLNRENNEWILKYGTRKVIPVIELKNIIKGIREKVC